MKTATTDQGLMARESRWWAEESRRAERLVDVAGHCYRALEQTRLAMATQARMYSNMPIIGLTPKLYRHRAPTSKMNRLTYNLVKSVIDTYVSLITKDRPKVTFVTSGGDWSLQQKAKLLEKFVTGIFYENDLNEIAPQVVRDSGIWGMGVVKCYLNEDGPRPEIKIERIFPHELLVDDQDAFYGDPQSIYHYRYIDRYALIEKYPDHAEALKTAGTTGFTDSANQGTETGTQLLDQIICVEGWHLPSYSGAGDGRHSIAAGKVLLEDEEYDRDYFPFAMLYRQKPLHGIWAQGIADELSPLQIAISWLTQNIQRSQRLAVGHWMIEENSRINTNAINDVVASIIRFAGVKPEYIAYQPVSSDVYAYRDKLISNGYEIIGVSQMSAASQKPPGLNSGKAMLVYADVQSQRFQPCYREYQNWHIDLAHQIVHLAREAEEKYPGFKVKATGSKQMMKVVKWADANLEDEEFTLELYPTNQLADDPAAKLQVVQDMINAGLIDPAAGKRLLDMPDLESLESFENASYDNVMRAYDNIVEDGYYFGPEPYMNLQESIRIMQMCYLKARLDNVPPMRLELIQRWIEEAVGNLPAPPPAPPAPAPGAAPPPGTAAGLEAHTAMDVQRQLAHQAAQNQVGTP